MDRVGPNYSEHRLACMLWSTTIETRASASELWWVNCHWWSAFAKKKNIKLENSAWFSDTNVTWLDERFLGERTCVPSTCREYQRFFYHI